MGRAPGQIWYKRLSHNDTPGSGSNQGGPVVPKPLWPLFPAIEYPTVANTTPAAKITATLVNEVGSVAVVETEFQLHTWSMTRTEYRIVGALKHLLENATKDDLLLVECLEPNKHYELSLAKQGTSRFIEASKLKVKVGVHPLRDWGYLRPIDQLNTLDDVATAEIDAMLQKPFAPIESNPTYLISKRIARLRVFRTSILGAYGPTCALCGTGLHSANGISEFEAAHVVPKKHVGTDDPRNSLSLCRAHHWAFDKGLVAVDNSRRIILHDLAFKEPGYSPLIKLAGRDLLDPKVTHLRAHPDALAHHRKHIFEGQPFG